MNGLQDSRRIVDGWTASLFFVSLLRSWSEGWQWKKTMKTPLFLRIVSNLLPLLMSAAMNVEEEQRYLSYYSCHFANMLPGNGEDWERARDEFVAATMVDAGNAPTPTPACVAWVCDSSLKVWQVGSLFYRPKAQIDLPLIVSWSVTSQFKFRSKKKVGRPWLITQS